MSSHRQLAAIMFTDIAGYTALMGRDEKKAFEILKKNREIQKPLVEKYHGKWIKELGDGVMASFHTVTDAVFCAAAIHQATQNVENLKLRIGIHLGEVVFEDNDVFGDGVNIASRLQALASIGSTWVSEAVYKNLTNKKEISSEFIKEEFLKNVSEPVKVYEISVKEIPGYLPDDINAYKTERTETTVKHKKSRLVLIGSLIGIVLLATLAAFYFLSKKPSLKPPAESGLAILPFTNNSGRVDLDFLSVGMASEIRNKLSVSKQFNFISALQATLPFLKSNKTTLEISHELGVDYILSGVYQANGDKIRIDAEFLDAKTGKLIWSMPLEKDLKDFFSIQTDIADEILNRFSIKEKTKEIGGTKNIEAYNAYAKGLQFENSQDFSDSNDLKSVREYEKAVSLDSNFADAWIKLLEMEGFFYVNNLFYDIDRLVRVKKYTEYIRTHFTNLWYKDMADAIYYSRVANEFDLALSACNKVLEQDPQNLNAVRFNSYIYKRKLQYEKSALWINKWLQLKPGDHFAYKELFGVFIEMGDTKNALKASLKMWELNNSKDNANSVLWAAWHNNTPVEQLPEDLKTKAGYIFELVKANQHADWNNYLKIAIREKYYRGIADAYFLLGNNDSSKYWANEGLKKYPNDFYLYALAGERDKAFSKWSAYYIPIVKSGDDLMVLANMLMDEIDLLIILGDYSEATKKLIQLNEKLPDWGVYTWYIRHNYSDVAKKKYPPFQQALDNLKLKPLVDISKYVKL